MEKRLIEVIYTVCKNHELSLTETFTITGDEWVKISEHSNQLSLILEMNSTEQDRELK